MKKTLFKWLFVALLVMAGFTLSWAGSGDPVLENKAITGTLGFDTGTTINEFSTDGTFAGDSDNAVPTEKAVKIYGDANWGGTVDTSGTPIDNDFAKFTDADTIEGRSYSETRSDLGLGSAATRAAEDSMTDGSNLPDGHAIKTYGDANWSGGSSKWTDGGTYTYCTAEGGQIRVRDNGLLSSENTGGIAVPLIASNKWGFASTFTETARRMLITDTGSQATSPAVWIEKDYISNHNFGAAEPPTVPVSLYAAHEHTGSGTGFTHSIMGYALNNGIGNNDVVAVSGRARKKGAGVGDACGVWGSAYNDVDQNGGVMGLEGCIYNNVSTEVASDSLGNKWTVGLHILAHSDGINAENATAGIAIDGAGDKRFWNGILFNKECMPGAGVAGTVGINMGDFNASRYPQYGIKFGKSYAHIFAPTQADSFAILSEKSVFNYIATSGENFIVRKGNPGSYSNLLTVNPAGELLLDTDGSKKVYFSGNNLMFYDATAGAKTLSQLVGGGGGTVDTSGTPIDNDFAKFTDADTIEGRSYSETRSDLGLVIGSTVQAQNAVLTDLAAISIVADNEFIVGSGAGAYSHQSGATARTSMGLGSAATRAAEDSMTDGSNLPDGHAIKTYGDANWSGGGSHFVTPGAGTLSTAAAAAADGDVLWLKEGVYTETIPITITSKSLSIIGAGPEVSIIRCTGTHGIVADTNSTVKHITLENFTIETTSSGTYTAIQLEGAASSSNVNKQFYIRNLNIVPDNIAEDYWYKGIRLIQGWNTVIDGCHIRGKNNNLSMQTGIELSTNAVDVTITNTHLYFMTYAIQGGGDQAEGIIVSNCIVVYVNYGVYGNFTVGESWFGIMNNHISAKTRCIYFRELHEAKIIGNLLYGGENTIGIDIATGQFNNISSNELKLNETGTNGIVLGTATLYNIVSNNIVRNGNTGIWLKAGANYNIVDANITQNCGNEVLDEGTGNSVTDNLAI